MLHFAASPEPQDASDGLVARSEAALGLVAGRSAKKDSRLFADGFAVLYKSHHRPLWCIAAAIVGDRNGADDIVQEAAMIALGKLDEFDPSTSFVAWMGQVVRFVALNHRRSRVRSRVVVTDPVVMAANAPMSRPADLGLSGMGMPLTAALDDLDETARSCLLMRTVTDMSYAQIAEALGIPEGTAMSHVHRSRHALRSKLESELRESGGRQA